MASRRRASPPCRLFVRYCGLRDGSASLRPSWLDPPRWAVRNHSYCRSASDQTTRERYGACQRLIGTAGLRHSVGAFVADLKDVSLSTVLLGRFNPLIFSPEWLQTNGVIGPDEASEAREAGIEVMAPNLSSINLGSMKLVVEDQRYTLIVGDEPLIRAKDFPATCFSLLRHTPVQAVGLNYNVTLVGNDGESWHRFGDTFAPKGPWGDFLADESGERLGGLRAMVMEQHNGPDPRWGYTRLTIDAQENLPPLHATLNVNNHFKVGSGDSIGSGADAYKLIEELWDQAMDRSKTLCDRIKQVADVA